MYLVRIKARQVQYQNEGYAVCNHPTLPQKYFTSKKLSDNEKYTLALQYLNSFHEQGSTTKR
jgi:hypothetical protein